jgi:hypothetical protein
MPANAPFHAGAMLQYVATLVGGLAGMQATYIGVPESISSRVSAYVTLGDLTPRPFATQVAQREPQVMVTFAYRVAGAEQSAELTIADMVDELTAAIYADRSLGGTSQNAVLSMSMNSNPAYMAVAGAEFRAYYVLITGLQTASTP